MAYPNLRNLKLQACCYERIATINNKVKLGNALQSVLTGGVLLTIFGPSRATVNTIPAITRAVAQKECELGAIRHIRGDLKLCQFWKAIAKTFE